MLIQKPNSRVIVGAQWGDEGKGKAVDAYGEEADLVVRFAGGANAGHTLEVNGQKLILHLIPSAAMHPGKLLILGDQMVIDAEELWQEFSKLQNLGLLQDAVTNFKISPLAHLVMPHHIRLDKAREAAAGKSAIGTTGRGIGPAYEFKASRCGIRMGHLRHPKMWSNLINKALAKANAEIGVLTGDAVGYCETAEYLEKARDRFLGFIENIDHLVYNACMTQKNILFEGAQGAGLDIDHGTYPYVTSSNALAAAACLGAGIGPTMIGDVIGVTKAYTTRVGNGPFPTRIGGEMEERLRQAGKEYGATTGRPRDVGWLDMPQLKTASRLNGMTKLFITKLDILRGVHPVRICVAYQIDGKQFINLDDVDAELLDKVTPVYQDLNGFDEDISSAKTFDELPQGARHIANSVSAGAGVLIAGVSVGPDREQTIWMNK
jgi:adenylosuccinate synthase